MESNTDPNQQQNQTPVAEPQVQAQQTATQHMSAEQPKEEGKSFLEHITGLFNRGKKENQKPQEPIPPQAPQQPQR